MIKSLQRIGNSQGFIIEKAILKLLNVDKDDKFEVELKDGGIFFKPIQINRSYEKLAQKHKKSLDKLAE